MALDSRPASSAGSNPAQIETLLRQGCALQDARRFGEARAAFQNALRLSPEHTGALHLMGVLASEMGDNATAVDLISRAIGLLPTAAAFYGDRGFALYGMGRLEEALSDFDRAIALKPDAANAYVGRANVQADLGRIEKAVADYDQALALKPDATVIHIARGFALHELGHLDQALASHDKALALEPRNVRALEARAEALKDLERLEEAEAVYRTIIEAEPDNVGARKNFFWLQLWKSEGTSAIEAAARAVLRTKLGGDGARMRATRTMSDFRAVHDREQTDYLRAQGVTCPGLAEANARLRDICARQPPVGAAPVQVRVSDAEIPELLRFRDQLYRPSPEAPAQGCLNPAADWAAIEAQYFAAAPGIVVIDDLLSPEALAELRRFCLASAIWTTEYRNSYLGAFAEDGFVSPLHLAIAREMRERMPRIVGPHRLEQMWAFKYSSQVSRGINVHADFARVNLNFWITPDEANLDPDSGGLVLYDLPAPSSWGPREYNCDAESAYRFLRENGSGKRVVPYRCNRAVLFNSSLFHETDQVRFKPGYENRRINVTYLFGRGLYFRTAGRAG